MSDEEKKAIKDLKEISHYCSLRAIDIEDKYSDTWAEYVVSIQKVFNLIEKQSKEIEQLKDEQEREKKDMSCDLTETRADNIDESTMLKQIKLKLQEKNIPIETLLAEFERLEEIEDRKVQIEYNNVFNKGVKSVEDKIKAKIKEISKEWAEGELDGEWYEFMKYHLESLLGKE